MLVRMTTDVNDLFRRVERDLTGILGWLGSGNGSADRRLFAPVEVASREGEYLFRFEMPGVDPEKIEVTVDNGILRVRGERLTIEEEEGTDVLRREISYGTYERSMALPEGVNPDKVSASYEGGILEVRIPHEAAMPAKKIPVQLASGEKKAIAA